MLRQAHTGTLEEKDWLRQSVPGLGDITALADKPAEANC